MVEDRQAAADQALTRAVLYRLLSLGFQMPSRERLHLMQAGERFATVAEALGGLSSPAAAMAGARLTALDLPDVERLRVTFVRLFGHTTRGPICACETEYGADNAYHQPQQLADIVGYYLAFGLHASTGADVRADHVACECEFMDFMNRKEALFLTTHADDGETLDVTRRASRTFLRAHLARFGRAFATRVMTEDPHGFFGILATILFELLEDECARLGIQSGSVDLAVRADLPDEAPMACGGQNSSDLIQIQKHP